MEVEILRSFRDPNLKRIFNRGEIIEGTDKWCQKIIRWRYAKALSQPTEVIKEPPKPIIPQSPAPHIDTSHRVVIMAAGGGHRWHNYQNRPKQLLEIDGEPIIKRTIRLLKEQGITDIYVTVKSVGQYGNLNVKEYITSPNELAIDRVWGARELAPCIFLYGDVYYTEDAINTILSDKHDYRFFGKAAGDKVKSNREIYAIKANDYVIERAGNLRMLRKTLKVRRALGGHLLIHCLNIPPHPKLKEHIASASEIAPIFTEINDITIDFDKPTDYVRWMIVTGRKTQKPQSPSQSQQRILKKNSYLPKDRVRTYYSINDLIFDVKHNFLPKVPADVDFVVGIPRDGMLPAYLISIYRNIPFTDLTSFCAGIVPEPGIKHRRSDAFTQEPQNILLVDDICASGNAMHDALEKINQASRDYKLYSGAVYVSRPQEKIEKGLIDFWGCELIGPRHYEWTHCDAVHLPNTMMDIDGILCPDCPPEKDNDGDEYLNWLQTVPLKICPQNVGCLITWRREKYKVETEAWLSKHGITYKRLVMANRENWPGPAEFKAHHYRDNQYRLMIDSSARQAEKINRLTRKPTIGFDTNEAFGLEK